VESDASNKLAHQGKPMRSTARFPDLIKKTIWKNRLLVSSANDVKSGGKSAGNVLHAAVGDSGSGQRIRSIDFQVVSTRDSQFPAPDFLHEIIGELKALEGFTIELLTESDEDGWTIPITVLANEDGEIDMCFFVAIEGSRLRERRIAVFSVARGSECIAVVAIEAEPVHMKLYLPSEVGLSGIWNILHCAAGDFISRPEPKTENTASIIRWIFEMQEV
jgi:hypothetical protein